MTANNGRSKFSPELAKLIRRIDVNTRGIAKIVSAEAYVEDEYGDLGRDRASAGFEAARFALIQERRNLKVQFEAELGRLRL